MKMRMGSVGGLFQEGLEVTALEQRWFPESHGPGKGLLFKVAPRQRLGKGVPGALDGSRTGRVSGCLKQDWRSCWKDS